MFYQNLLKHLFSNFSPCFSKLCIYFGKSEVQSHILHIKYTDISWRNHDYAKISVSNGPGRKQRNCILLSLFFLTSSKYYNSLCECTYLLQSTILLPHPLHWHHLMDRGDLSSFLLKTSLFQEAFIMLLDILQLPGNVNRKGHRLSLPLDAFLVLLFFIWAVQSTFSTCVYHFAWHHLLAHKFSALCSNLSSSNCIIILLHLRSFLLPKMQQFAEMVHFCEPTINNVIGSWMVFLFHRSALVSIWCRMHFTAKMIVIRLWIMYFPTFLMENVILCFELSRKLGRGMLTACFLPHLLKGLGVIKSL